MERRGRQSAGTIVDPPLTTWLTPFRAFRHRNFRLYAIGMAISVSGNWMQSLALSWLVYRLTRSEWLLGLTVFCSSIPVLLLSPVAGVVADRFPRRSIVMTTQSLAMVHAVTLTVLTLSELIQVWHVLLLALALGAITAFDIPGRQSLFFQLVGKPDLLSAISLNSVIFNGARIVGPSIAGVVIARFGEGVCFAVNAVSYLAVLASFLAMKVSGGDAPRAPESPLTSLVEGFQYVLKRPPLLWTLAACGFLTFAAAPGPVLAPMFADAMFHQGSRGLGFFTAAMGAGAITGTLLLARNTALGPLPMAMVTSATALGAGMIIISVSPWFGLCLLLAPLLGMGIMRSNAAANTMVQSRIADDYRGRIMGIYSMMVTGMYPVGGLAAGAFAQLAGSRVAMAAGGILCLITSLLLLSRRPTFMQWITTGSEEERA